MRTAIITACLMLAGCNTGLPPAQQDWIEVPLTENTWQAAERSFASASYPVPVAAGSALEFKIGMVEGDSIVYDLEAAISDPSLLDIEFHGHTERVGETPGTVMFYVVHNEGRESGTLTAPFSGIHGWYLNNRSEEDIVVTVSIAGFYEEID